MKTISKILFHVLVIIVAVAALAFATGYARGQEPNQPEYLVHITTESPLRIFKAGTSGMLVDPQYILTRNNNIGPARTSITVRFENGDEVEAEVEFRNIFLDLAILKLDEIRYEKPVEIRNDSVKGGQTVVLWGFSDGPEKITGEVFNLVDTIRRTQFRFRGQAGRGFCGGPVLIDGKLAGVMIRSFPGTSIWCTNTPQIREFLENLDD